MPLPRSKQKKPQGSSDKRKCCVWKRKCCFWKRKGKKPVNTISVPSTETPIQKAIGRLNIAIQQLYQINGFLDDSSDGKINENVLEKDVEALSLDLNTMDLEIDKVSGLTDRLLSAQRGADDSHQGILPATKSLLRTLTPAIKMILMAASQVSSLVNFHQMRLIARSQF